MTAQAGSCAPRRRLRHAQRIHNTREFQDVYAARKKIHAPQVIVCYAPNGTVRSRLGVSVSSRHGGAVVRNRIKRVLRAAFRLAQDELPRGFDFVLIPKHAGPFTTTEIKAALLNAIRRIQPDAKPRPGVGDPRAG